MTSPRRGARRSRRLAGAAAVLLTGACLGVSGGVAFPSTAGADPVGQCTTTSGVIVAVDFSPWGGAVERGCSVDPVTGLAAMGSAGFTTAQVSTEPGFICRITDPSTGTLEPTSVPDNCLTTPPATAYWSYWHAGAGSDTWSYSQLGAASATPGPGSVDAWVFGSATDSSGGPSFSPAAVRATNTTPAVAATAPTSVPTTSTPPVLAGGATAASTTTTAPPASPTTTIPTAPVGVAVPTTTTGAGHSGATTHPRIVDVSPTAARSTAADAATGSPLPLLIGAVAVAMLAGGAAVAARRRRRPG